MEGETPLLLLPLPSTGLGLSTEWCRLGHTLSRDTDDSASLKIISKETGPTNMTREIKHLQSPQEGHSSFVPVSKRSQRPADTDAAGRTCVSDLTSPLTGCATLGNMLCPVGLTCRMGWKRVSPHSVFLRIQ